MKVRMSMLSRWPQRRRPEVRAGPTAYNLRPGPPLFARHPCLSQHRRQQRTLVGMHLHGMLVGACHCSTAFCRLSCPLLHHEDWLVHCILRISCLSSCGFSTSTDYSIVFWDFPVCLSVASPRGLTIPLYSVDCFPTCRVQTSFPRCKQSMYLTFWQNTGEVWPCNN